MRKKCTACEYVYTGEVDVKFCSLCGSPMEALTLDVTPEIELIYFRPEVKLDVLFADVQIEFNNRGRVEILVDGDESVKETVRFDNDTLSATIPGAQLFRKNNDIRKYRNEFYVNDEKLDPAKKLKIRLSLPWVAKLTFGQFAIGDVCIMGEGGGLTLINAGYMDIAGGSFDSVDYTLSGEGDWTLDTVKYDLKVVLSGSGSVEAESAGNSSIKIAGSGDVEIESVIGNLTTSIPGSGNITINGGAVDELTAEISGSGNIELALTAITGVFKISGSGNISVNNCLNVRSRRVSGAGSISIG